MSILTPERHAALRATAEDRLTRDGDKVPTLGFMAENWAHLQWLEANGFTQRLNRRPGHILTEKGRAAL